MNTCAYLVISTLFYGFIAYQGMREELSLRGSQTLGNTHAGYAMVGLLVVMTAWSASLLIQAFRA